MELEGGSSAGSILSLRWNEDVLSTEGTMTCLMIACCRCDRVPALLFTRPYVSRRRWNEQGEIELVHPPAADTIPQWPKKMFVDVGGLPSRGKGVFSSTAGEFSPQLAPNIEYLCQQDIVETEIDGDNLFFRMAQSVREEIWEQTCTQDRLLLWFDLLKLIIHSSPDIYAEMFWQTILCNCKPVIDSTLLPFLSVIEWPDLQHHKAMIPRLLSFLVHYSIFNGFSPDTCVYLAPAPLRHIESSCNLVTKEMIELLKFKEILCLRVLPLQGKDPGSLDDLMGASFETAELQNILGFLIASVLWSNHISLPSQCSNEVIAIALSWRERQGRSRSTMSTFAQNLLFMDGPNNQSSRLSYTLGKADMQVNFTMAMAMIQRSHFVQAYTFLIACAKDLRSTDPVHEDREYLTVTTELVKCCNILNQEEKGEATALEALQHRYSNSATRNEIGYLQIALADSFIGQSKYSEADRVLQKVLASGYVSTYLATVASLRLNKVKRRLGVLDVSAFTRDSVLRKALTDSSDSKDHVRDECLEELSCSISFTQQKTVENVAVANPVLDAASAIVARQPISTSNWRTRILNEQIVDEFKGRTKEKQLHRQPPATRSLSTEDPQKSAPLHALFLWEGLINDILDPDILSLNDLFVEMDHDIKVAGSSQIDFTSGILDLSLNIVFLQSERDISSNFLSILLGQGFTGRETFDRSETPCWAVFHRSLHVRMPEFLPVLISADEIMHTLISIKEENYYGIGQDKHLKSRHLRLPDSRVVEDHFLRLVYLRGISQEDPPTDAISSTVRNASIFSERLVLNTAGAIYCQYTSDTVPLDLRYLNPSTVKLGRFIEDLDRPLANFYDSELSSHMTGAVWHHGTKEFDVRRGNIHSSGEHGLESTIDAWWLTDRLTTEEIKFHWSICSLENMDPIFAEPLEKQRLTDWIYEKGGAFFITAYQTYTNTFIYKVEDQNNLGIKSLPGELVTAICVKRVNAVRGPDGEATLEFGKSFWRVYWGLVDKADQSIPEELVRMPTDVSPPPVQRFPLFDRIKSRFTARHSNHGDGPEESWK